jgi:4-diphosphocytidyl-2-C-methyl-D-erythritol kinase
MVVFPNAKINLGLRITSKRTDGYHNLDTLFYPIPLFDVLEVVQYPSQDIIFESSGKKIEGIIEQNLCAKAYHILKNDFPQIPGIQVHLHKHIPMGAGMGGGSADGAFMIKLLNEKFKLGLDNEKMEAYALQLGSDCPIFIRNKPCYATGRGEQMEDIALDLSAYYLLMVSPGIHVSTAVAFKNVSPDASIQPCKDIIQEPIETWKDRLFNDFEKTVFQSYPVLKQIKDDLYALGAVYASMTGSGSSFYGIYKSLPDGKPFAEKGYELNLIKPKI